jgi:hypothetical protein
MTTQLSPRGVHGESAHAVADVSDADSLLRFRYSRRPLKIISQEAHGGGSNDSYGGVDGIVVLEGEYFVPSTTSSSTVLVCMHPCAIMTTLPMPIALARAGLPVVVCSSRFPNNDSNLLMEKATKDLGAVVRYCRESLGFQHVVLLGWSGGGSLSAFYQSQAESPTLTAPVDFVRARLPPADGLLIMAAHASRARILTEWLDPSIWLLHKASAAAEEAELREFDLYGPSAPQPPYTAEFVRRYRAAQVAQSERVTAWLCAMVYVATPHVRMLQPRMSGAATPHLRCCNYVRWRGTGGSRRG